MYDYRICSRVRGSDYRRGGGGGRSADEGYKIGMGRSGAEGG